MLRVTKGDRTVRVCDYVPFGRAARVQFWPEARSSCVSNGPEAPWAPPEEDWARKRARDWRWATVIRTCCCTPRPRLVDCCPQSPSYRMSFTSCCWLHFCCWLQGGTQCQILSLASVDCTRRSLIFRGWAAAVPDARAGLRRRMSMRSVPGGPANDNE